jgi:hypothetical protein
MSTETTAIHTARFRARNTFIPSSLNYGDAGHRMGSFGYSKMPTVFCQSWV